MLSMSLSSSLRLMRCVSFLPIVAWSVPATSRFLNFSMSNLSLDWVRLFAYSDELEMSPSLGYGHFLWILQEAPCPVDVNSRLESLPHQDVTNLVVILPVLVVACSPSRSRWFVGPLSICQYKVVKGCKF